jgi:NAD-dependent DNA ligase
MAATHLFGRGFAERRIKEILKVFPNILHEKWTKKELKKNIIGIDGFSDITAAQFADNLEEFKQFCVDLNKIYDISHITKKKDIKKDITENKEKGNDKLKGKTVVFTGVRDKDLELYIENSGGKVSSSVSKNTNIVIHSDNPDTSNSKYEKAKELNQEDSSSIILNQFANPNNPLAHEKTTALEILRDMDNQSFPPTVPS